MATIEAYETKLGKRYLVRYRTANHRQTKKRGFTTQRDAKAFAATVEVAIRRDEYVTPTDGRTKLSAVAEPWLAAKKGVLKKSSYASVETAWRVHIEPRWGEVAVSKIGTDEVQTWVSDLAQTKSPSLVARVHAALSGILDRAVQGRLVAVNRAQGVELPKRRPSNRPYLNIEEVEALAGRAGKHADLVRVLAYVGLRWSEAIAIRGRHIDLKRGRIMVIENAVQTGSDIEVGSPKDHEKRSVPVPAFLIESLQARVKGAEDLVFGQGTTAYMLRPDSKRSWFKTAVQGAQLEHPRMPTITPHDLRHTAASIAVHAGANVKAVQRMLGHASAALTLDTYADLFDTDLDLVAANIDTTRENVCAQNVPKSNVRGEATKPTPA